MFRLLLKLSSFNKFWVIITGPMLTQSTWQHITVTWSSDTGLYGYVNGNLAFSSTSVARNEDRKAGGVLVLGQVGRLRYTALNITMLIEFQLKFIDV